MQAQLNSDLRQDLLKRGFSRRSFGRFAALITAGASLPFYNEAALAQGLSALRGNIPPDAVRINANENPLGPCPEAAEAIYAVVKKGGRYLYEETFGFTALQAELEGLKSNYVLPFAGSSAPLHQSVMAFTSPSRSLVMAEPGYEAADRAARFVGAKTFRVPLTKDKYAHDVKAMVKAAPDAGVFYICNPNNPTGTLTPREDIEWLLANKPAGSVLVLDEAYIHLSGASAASDFVAADKDVIILRTFSKLYGMAGLRAGAAFGRPDLLAKIQPYSAGALAVTGMVGAAASLRASKTLVPQRRELIGSIREDVCSWLAAKKIPFVPSVSNKIMIDTGSPGGEVFNGMLKEKVVIGRTWAAWPNHVRVSIGTRDEMEKFKSAFAKVMGV